MGALRVDTTSHDEREAGIAAAKRALAAGDCIVLPTDTVYGIACDPFQPAAVQGLLDLKGRSRAMPPPVLVPSIESAEALVAHFPHDLGPALQRFWPGGVTFVLQAAPEVSWDLGETEGTVALRMPAHDVALDILRATGPLAVSSANLTGELAAMNAQEAITQFGDGVSVYFDAGRVGASYSDAPGNAVSTIIDASTVAEGGAYRVIRRGVVPVSSIREVLPGEWSE